MTIPSSTSKEVRVAIVGSGLTGLVATYLLTAHSRGASSGKVKVNVEIFERAATLGMDSASISVPLPISPPSKPAAPHLESACTAGRRDDHDHDGTSPLRARKRPKLQTQPLADVDSSPRRSLRIDVPMRAFTGGYYPQLLALYRHLGIRTKKTNFTYSFAALPSTSVETSSASPSSSSSASSSSTRSCAPDWTTTSQHKPATTWLSSAASTPPTDTTRTSCSSAPSPSVLYNGANGIRGASLPAMLGRPPLSSPIRISSILQHMTCLRTYFGTLLLLVLGYLQLLVIATWHHYLGHTCDSAHPLRSYTLRDLVADPFPSRSSPPKMRIGLHIEKAMESILCRLVCLDEQFARQTLTPLFSAVMTSSLESVWSCPASEVLDYVALTLGKDHFVVRDGVRTVVASLLQHVDRPQANSTSSPARDGSSGSSSSSKVWTNAEVRHVRSQQGKVWIDVVQHASLSSPQRGTQDMSRQPSSASTERTLCNDQDQLQQHGPFDHVIFATQANQTAHFLQQYVDSVAAAVEKEQRDDWEEGVRLRSVIDVLSSFKYEKSVVVNHTDRALLPRHKADWRDLNLVSPTQPVLGWEQRRTSGGSAWTDEEIDEEMEKATEGSASEETPFSPTFCGPTKAESGGAGSTMATHVLTLPSPATADIDLLVMQTTNPLASLQPHPSTILSQSTFERAVIDVEAHLARQSLFRLSRTSAASPDRTAVETAGGRNLTLGTLQQQKQKAAAGVWVCGSWAVGIPLLEGCVVSARLVAEEILRREGLSVPAHARW